jgi:hypothetical protein
MKATATWQEDYQTLLGDVQALLDHDLGSAAKLSGEMVLIQVMTGLTPIFLKCREEAILETTQIAANVVKKFVDEERTKMETEGFCPVCKQAVGK